MAKQVIMPKLGMAMKEGMIGKWPKADGDTVTIEDTIAIIVTKKITYELKPSGNGILRHVVQTRSHRADRHRDRLGA